PGAVGNAGGVSITTGSLEVTNGAQLGASTFGEGNAGRVEINATDSIKFDGETKDGFNSGAFSDVSSGAVGNAGGVSITTGSLEVTNGAQFGASTFEEGDAGSVTIHATDSIKFDGEGEDGFPSGTASLVSPGAVGNAGGVSITTGSLEVTNGALISADTFGEGDAGSVTIHATDKVKFDGSGSNNPSAAVSGVISSGAVGKAGGVSITTGSLEVTNGALLGAETEGVGDAGSVTIHATDSIKFDGESKDGRFASRALSNVQPGAVGKAGGVSITTGSLEVTNGAEVSVSTEGEGDAGRVEINANTFEASNGGQLISNTSSQFSAGNIILKVKDKITLSGSDTGIFADTTEGSTGPGGSINIDPQSVTIQDGATIAVNSDGSGQGGSVTLAAEKLTLDNGSITAETASNQGGNITLNIQDLLSFINSGEITTTAGTEQAGGDGGDIGINSDFIVGFPTQEQYRITANAFEGNGGNIDITANAIFGAEFFEISASSQFGLKGEISINTPDVNPLQGLDNLPTEVVDASELIAKRCLAGDGETAEQQSEFTITGRGGLPSNPNESLRGDAVLSPEWVSLDSETTEKQRDRGAKKQESIVSPQIEIVQATGWVMRPNGKVRLIANHPNAVPSSPGIKHPHCQAAK
nr:S-layer family protein [Xenococcus sp. MO_188.B8]